MKNQLILFALIFSTVCFPQCNNRSMNLLKEKLNYTDWTNESKLNKIKLLKQILNYGYMSYLDDLSVAYYKIGNNRKGLKYLEKAMKHGYTLKQVFNNKELAELMPQKDSIYLTSHEKEIQGYFFSKVDLELYNLSKKWFYNDQLMNIFNNKFIEDSIQHNIRQKIFTKNLTELREWVESKNKGILPQFSQLGYQLKPIYLMIIHHTRKDSIDSLNYNYFKNKLYDEVCNHTTYSPYTYTQIVDNMQLIWEEGHKQLYGQNIDYKNKTIFPLINYKLVDSLRNDIGLAPLIMYAKKNNLTLPKEYQYEESLDTFK